MRPVKILLIEDDPGHALLIERNLRRANLGNEFVKLPDGQQALDYIAAEVDPTSETVRPAMLILLDLNLPGVDGYQVLQSLKSNPLTRTIPVIILTTTDDSREVARCYELGCNVYITKPIDYGQFSDAIQQIGLFLAVVTLP